MENNSRVMLLEFNELCPPLMERFMAQGHLPNFRRFFDESGVYTTEAAERGWDLNPWVQWVTVHSGLDYEAHKITELDEGADLKAPRVWDVVSESGAPVWVCGSMNVGYKAPVKGLVMPDPWTTKTVPHPEELAPFFRFVQQNVREHTSGQARLTPLDYVKFLVFMVRHGLSWTTVKAIAGQLLAERLGGGEAKWKRATLLDKLQLDVFTWYYRAARPRFSTFFSNSTAHYQHFYWREMEPELFKVQPTAEQKAAHEKSILFGYREMDRMLPRLLALADKDTTVVFATALSQQPCLVYEDQGGKVMYRPRDFAQLAAFVGITEPHEVVPVMAEVFNLNVKDEAQGAAVEAKLLSLRTVSGAPAMQVLRKGTVLNVKCLIHERTPKETRLSLADGSKSAPFHDLFYQIDEASRSGMHHPDGMLWIRTPGKTHVEHPGKVPLASLAPTLLKLLSLPAPAQMKAPPIAV